MYSSTYVVLSDPAGGRAFWIRDTRDDREPRRWLTAWTPELTQVRGTGSGDHQRGEVDGHAWDLTWEASAPEFSYGRAPGRGARALVPHGRAHGHVDDADVEGWHVMVGRNWGRSHPRAWTWKHGANGDDWFDELRVNVGIWLTLAHVHTDGVTRRSRLPLDLTVVPVDEAHWDYGPHTQVRNSSVATAVLQGRPFATAIVEHGA